MGLAGTKLDEVINEVKDEDLSTDNKKHVDDEDKRTDLTVTLRPAATSRPAAVVIGLNPSKARVGELNGDRTIPILSRVLYGLGFGKFTMLNLYTIREPNSKKLIEKVKEYREAGRLNECLTDFEDFQEALKKADAIFVAVGGFHLGNDPRNENFNIPRKEHEEAIKNMIEALEPHAAKTWGVKRVDESDNSRYKWNVHPNARSRGWTKNPEQKEIERFPVEEYLDKMSKMSSDKQ